MNLSILVLNLLGVTTVIEGAEPTGLPEYYLVGVSTVRYRLYLNFGFDVPIPDHMPIIQADPASGDCNDERDRANCVEYQCIMDVFTLSSLSAQVRAICVISIKGSCPK